MTQSDEAKQPASEANPAEPIPDEAALAPEPAAAPKEPKGARVGVIVGLVMVLAVVMGAVVTWPQWRHLVEPPPAPAPTATSDQALRNEMQALRGRLAELESRPAASAEPAQPDPRVAQLMESVRALQAQPQVPARLIQDVDGLAAQVAELRKTAADAATVLRLADRLDRVEADLRDIQSRRSTAAALLLAVGQLREAINLAMPYDAELRAVRALAPPEADLVRALDTLKGRAAAGIPTRPVLAGRFTALAPALVRAELLPARQSWWRDTVNQMSTLLTVRREDGEAAGQSPAAIVARTEAALNRGDLAGAIAQAEALSGAAAETAAPWLADARARLAADGALSELTAHAVASVGPRQ